MAKATTKYGVNGVLYDSLSKLSEAVGFRVNRKNIEAGNLEGIYIVEVDENDNVVQFVAGNPGKQESSKEVAPTATLDEEPTDTVEDADDDVDNDTDSLDEEDTPLTNTPVDTDDDEGTEYPEKGHFPATDKGLKAIKKLIKGLTDAQITEWAELEGLTWTRNEHAPIDRMRAVMAIKAFHGFGKAPSEGGKKSKSKYADYTTEALIQMALDNDVEVKDAKGNPQIERMYAIMALREAGLLA